MSTPGAHTQPPERRFVSVAIRLALAVVVVLGAACAVVVIQLTELEHGRLVESKRGAAVMVVEQFVASVVPAVDFGDDKAIEANARALWTNRELVYVGVWLAGQDRPVVALERGGAGATAPAAPPRGASARLLPDVVEITRPISNPTHEQVGAVLVRFSLAAENAAFQTARRDILAWSLLVTAAVAAILLGVARITVVGPLAQLAGAARDMTSGKRTRVDLRSSDELGRLSRVFNDMSDAIVDREQRLAGATRRVQALLDHMEQAIVVFDKSGRLLNERSRPAEVLFGERATSGAGVLELLYPHGRTTAIEREAFEEWLGLLGAGVSFDELSTLTPTQVVLRGDGDEKVLQLAFRLVAHEGNEAVMLLATDVTKQRDLERSVADRDRELKRQTDAMRRLVAGGGQLFVRFLDGARQRLARCQELLATAGKVPEHVVLEIFQHVHTLRAEARAFDLLRVEAALTSVEVALAAFRTGEATSLNGTEDPAGSLARVLQEVARLIDEAEHLFVEQSPIGRRVLGQVTVQKADLQRLYELVGTAEGETGDTVRRLLSRPFGEATFLLAESLQRWAERARKKAHLEIVGRDALVPPELARVLTGVLSHLLRNAVAHGIEAPELREAAGKPSVGRIKLECVDADGGVCILVEDDGAGVDLAALTERARREGLGSGAWGLALAFEPGVSTAESDDELAGRGIGLAAVHDELGRAGYEVDLASDLQRGTRVTIRPSRKTDRGSN